MSVLNMILYFLITIIILVFVHEFGHFIAAKICKMRVDKFYLFFDFFNARIFKFIKGETEYGIGAFPLGGYVKVSGMIDESMDKEFLNKPPQPWEFRSKPVYQRMFVITAGVIMNTLLAFAIFYVIVLAQGEMRWKTTTIGYVAKNSVAEKFGIQSGDKILSINNSKMEFWDDVQRSLLFEFMGENLDIKLESNGNIKDILIPKSGMKDVSEETMGIYPSDYQAEISQVKQDKPAGKLGLIRGDIITDFNGIKITHSQQLRELLKFNGDKVANLKWQRDGKEYSGTVQPDADSTIGIGIGNYVGATQIINYNVISAIPAGAKELYNYGVVIFLKSMWKIIRGDIPFTKAVGGPIKIAQFAQQSAEAGALPFLRFMAMLSITLAIINILPFPALDGGHFVFLIYEGIFRRPVSHKVQIVVQNVGFIILMLFMAFVVYNDIIHI